MLTQLTRYASWLGVRVDDVEVELRGVFDHRGKFGWDLSTACQELSYVAHIRSPESEEKVRELMTWVERGCHALNTFRQPVPVVAKVELNWRELTLEA